MKYVATVFVTAVIVFLIVTVYYKGFPVFPKYNKTAVSTQVGVDVTSSEVATPIATSTPVSKTVVKAGGVLVFKSYSLELPTGWESLKEGAPSGDIELDKLTLTKDGYKITFLQAATGGAPCLYPGDPDQEGPSSRFIKFVDFTTQTGEIMRKSSNDTKGFTVCEKQGVNGFGAPTSFGHISITLPVAPSLVVMAEIDEILASIEKI